MAPPPLAQHSSATVEHYTPRLLADLARAVLGSIDLDPASCEAANQFVGAARYFTRKEDGLSQDWGFESRVYLNPPGGKLKGESSAVVWWNKLVLEVGLGNVKSAIFLGFSLEFLQTAQQSALDPLGCPFCIPRRRTAFIGAAENGQLTERASPTHANVIVGIPPADDLSRAVFQTHFRRAFRTLGTVVNC